jgi:hypothetical protein
VAHSNLSCEHREPREPRSCEPREPPEPREPHEPCSYDFTIVGIAPKGFTGTNALLARELWVPLGAFDSLAHDAIINNGRGLTDRSNSALWVAVLLKPGVTRNQLDERLAVLSRDLQREYAAENRGQVLGVHTIRASIAARRRATTPARRCCPLC